LPIATHPSFKPMRENSLGRRVLESFERSTNPIIGKALVERDIAGRRGRMFRVLKEVNETCFLREFIMVIRV